MMNADQTLELEPPEHSAPYVLADVAAMIREIIGEEYAGDLIIEMETSFSRELELESIEHVALAEKLRARYGERLDLARWLSGMELEQIIALNVGDLVEQIVQCMSTPTTV